MAHTDSQLVADLYRRYAPAIYRRALSLLKDPQEANDVVQDTFLGFLKNQANLRGQAQPFTVLYQIATYQSVDRLRRKSRWSGILGGLEFQDGEEDAMPEPASEGDARRVEAAQDLALLTKGEDERTLTAAFLYFVDGHTTQEVAEVLDLSRKTVGKLLAQFSERARQRGARLEPEAA